MRPLFPVETRRQLREHNPKWHVKAIIQGVCTFFAFIALILFADATALTNEYFNSAYGDWSDWMPLFPVLISLIYNPVTFFLTIFRRNGKPIHPGWDVGAHLITWALAIPSIVFSVGWGWFWWWQPVLVEFGSYIPCNGWNFWSEPCNAIIYTAGKIEIAANVFLGLITILTFTLFVMACIATHKHRRAVRRNRASTRNIQLQYNRSPQEHAAQEPPAYSPRKMTTDEEEGGVKQATTAVSGGATKYA
ncbi:MAG: hypothetical protein Q9220_000492 [cf. Caloplaca sp. 1 TL-2023]